MELGRVYEAVDYVMDQFRKMDVWEVGVFKTLLIAFGILIGTYACKACRKAAPLIWLAFIVSLVVLLYRLLIAPVLYPEED